jgi:hypothetical protein
MLQVSMRKGRSKKPLGEPSHDGFEVHLCLLAWMSERGRDRTAWETVWILAKCRQAEIGCDRRQRTDGHIRLRPWDSGMHRGVENISTAIPVCLEFRQKFHELLELDRHGGLDLLATMYMNMMLSSDIVSQKPTTHTYKFLFANPAR